LKLQRGRSERGGAPRQCFICVYPTQQEQRLGSKSNFGAGLRGTGGDGLFFLYLFSNNNVRARRCVDGLALRLRRAHDNTGDGDDALTSAEDAGGVMRPAQARRLRLLIAAAPGV